MRGTLSFILVASVVLSMTVLVSPSVPAPTVSPPGFPGPHYDLPNPDLLDYLPMKQNPPILGHYENTRAGQNNDVAVLLVEFSDVTHNSANTPGAVETKMNGTSKGDLRDYYEKNSYGTYHINATVEGGTWFHSIHNMAYYGSDSTTGTDDFNGPIYNLVRETVQLADPFVNFGQYDHDGDGIVDHLYVVHAGEGQESNPSNPQLIWSHRWAVVNPNAYADGVQIYNYIMVSESSPIGVIAHEFGHDLGLPDLYNTVDRSSPGAGEWEIMATGSWNAELAQPKGTSPSSLSAWSKAKLGWLTPNVVTAARYTQEIRDVETYPIAFKLPIRETGAQEYFLVENREKQGYDTGLPGEGLIIWHVDESVTNNDNDAHMLLKVMEADADSGFSPNDAGDPWSNNAVGFTPDSVPNSNGYGNIRTGWKVFEITPASLAMTASISRVVNDDMSVIAVQCARSVPVNAIVPIAVEVANLGARNQTDVPIVLSVYLGGHAAGQKVFESNRTLSPVAKTYANLTYSYQPAAQGKYLLEITAALGRDEIPENNFKLVHLNAIANYFYDDVETGNKGWTAAPTGEQFQWQIVQQGSLYGDAMSPMHSWRFGNTSTTGGVNPPYSITSQTITFQAGPLYLSFFQRYELSVKGDITVNNTDVAYVNISVGGGPWTPVQGGRFQGIQERWGLFVANLTNVASAPGTLRLRFECTAGKMPLDGGWWIDDLFVSSYMFGPAVAILPVHTSREVNPGDRANFIFKLVNVGDFPDEFRFYVSSEMSWLVAMSNATTTLQPELMNVTLTPDQEATLTLVVQTPGDVLRGTEATFTVTAVSKTSASTRDAFDAKVTISDPLGLAKFMRYIVLFVVVLVLLVAIAVIIDHVKRQRGQYYR